MFGKRILVAVPHPDDEIVACMTALRRAQSEGAAIFALYLTHGCVARETLWPWQRPRYEVYVARRRHEAENVARFLNLTPAGWSDRPARYLWRQLDQVRAEVALAMAAFNIDQLWVPAYEGGNADHDGLNAVGSTFLDRVSVLEFAEYNFFGGRACSQRFPFPRGDETVLELTHEETRLKKQALTLYPSERGNLNYVRSEYEVFRPLKDYDYRQPPHEGTLWYARFQWVPFRHPRVDFTQSHEVSTAIGTFFERVVSAA